MYLHGEAHAHDTWFVSDRERLDQSPAMRLTSRAALAQAGKTIADVDVFDIYSCFPSVVQIACKELGISPDDKRGLTVTGGLPYFGGPGNNYVTHAIAEMVQRVRAKPGAYGLVMANVGLVTKESVGLFSTERPNKALHARADSDAIQREIDAQTKVRFTEAPQGDATIETYAVLHGKNGRKRRAARARRCYGRALRREHARRCGNAREAGAGRRHRAARHRDAGGRPQRVHAALRINAMAAPDTGPRTPLQPAVRRARGRDRPLRGRRWPSTT